MIKYDQIHHVSLVVTDIKRAKKFYSEILGLKEIERPDLGFPGAWYQIGPNQQIHLLVHPPAQAYRTAGGIDTRDGHFAFRIKNYYETAAYLKEKGIKIVENPTSKTGFAQIYCCDPDGNVIEFNLDQSELI